MQVQLEKWQSLLESGHKRVGWKIGFNAMADQQRMRLASPIVGFLTSESVLESGSTYIGNSQSKLMVEAEVAILIGKDVPTGASKAQVHEAIECYAPAIEIVDLSRTSHDISSILEDNIFHETVVFGQLNRDFPKLSATDISATVSVNGEIVQFGDPCRYPQDMSDIVSIVVTTLSKQNKNLQAGDWIISGSITQPIEVFTDDALIVSLAPLGSLLLNVKK